MPDADSNAIPFTPTAVSAAPAAELSAPSDPVATVRSGAAAQVSSQSADEHLILALRDGSEEAFTILFHRYKQPIFGFFSRRLAYSARAEELTQETFIALFRAAKRYQPSASFRTYLYAIAFRILRSDRRKSQFRALFFGSPAAADSASVPSPTEDSLWVRRALAKLDGTDREIVMLREYQQLSYAEIATVLVIPLNTVRARSALRDLLIPPQLPSPSENLADTCSAGRPVLSPAAFSAPQSSPQVAGQPTTQKGPRQ